MSRIGIIGAGSFGMALAKMLAETGHSVSVWTFHAEKLDLYKKNRRYPGLDCVLPESINYEKSPEALASDKEILVTAVPSVNLRDTVKRFSGCVPDGQLIVNVSKGMERGTLLGLTEVIEDEMKKAGKSVRTVALSGPTHAEEVAKGMPSTIVAASKDPKAAVFVQGIFMNDNMRVYTNDDIKGVELCGAMKNVIAIATGICAGIGYGDNSKAALITRGLAEITRLGVAVGCRQETFAGLAGMGDLIVTATSGYSRNNRAGYLLGQGYPVDEVKRKVGMTIEGLNALPAILRLAEEAGAELPICIAVDRIVNEGADTRETVRSLMMRDRKSETA